MGDLLKNSSAEKVIKSDLDTTQAKAHNGNWVLAAAILGTGIGSAHRLQLPNYEIAQSSDEGANNPAENRTGHEGHRRVTRRLIRR